MHIAWSLFGRVAKRVREFPNRVDTSSRGSVEHTSSTQQNVLGNSLTELKPVLTVAWSLMFALKPAPLLECSFFRGNVRIMFVFLKC